MKLNIVHFKTANFNAWIQWIAAFGVFAQMMQVGILIGWVSPNITRLTANDSKIFGRPLTAEEASWVASLPSLTGIVGAVLASVSVEMLGSRRTVLLTFVASSVVWSCMIAAESIIWLYVSRLTSGLVFASSYGSFSLYLGEIALPRIRGTLISIAAGGSSFGIVLGTVAETYLPMRISSSLYLAQCLLAILLFAWLKDSPYYLVKNGDLERARKSVEMYFVGCDASKELQEVQNFVESRVSQTFRDKLRDLKSPSVLKSMFLLIAVFALPHFSGTIPITAYMETILRSAKTNVIEPRELVVYANVTSVVSTLLTFVLIDKLGRRFLLVVSSLGTSAALFSLGMHFYELNNGADAQNLQWLPIVSLLGYLILYAVGYSPVPSTVLSEIFTDNVKCLAALVAALTAAFFSFVMTKSYQPMVDSLGEYYVFWIYASLSLLTIPYVLFFLPETKGKTFQEIQDSLVRKR